MRNRTAISFSDEVWRKIRKRALMPIILLYAAFVAVIVLLYNLSILIVSKQEFNYASKHFKEIVTSYESQIKEISEDPEVLSILKGESNTNAFSEEVYGFVNEQEIGADFFLLDVEGKPLLGSSTILSDYLIEPHPFHTGYLFWLESDSSKTIKLINQLGNARSHANVLSIGRAIVCGNEIVGFFIFELNPEEILEYISFGEIGNIIVTNSFYTTLLTSKNEYIDKYSKLRAEYRVETGIHFNNSQSFFVISGFDADMDSWFFVVVQLDLYVRYILITSIMILIIFIISMIIIAMANKRFVGEEAASIDALVSRIQSMKKLGLHASVEPVKSDFVSLESSFNQLLHDIRELGLANQMEATMRQKAEIKQLESQFNPHFLFNSLEIIRCYVKVDPIAANKMILNLSSMLRYSIDSSQQLVFVCDDVQYVENYLTLIKMARPSSIDYSIRVSSEAEKARIPKLCIQPIVENSIKYSDRDGSTRIDISISIAKGRRDLEILIDDNGPGIDPCKLAEIRRILESEEDPEKYSGLYNINRRFKLLYGQSYGIEIESGSEGTSVTMCLPLELKCTE